MTDKIFKIVMGILILGAFGLVLINNGGENIKTQPTDHVYGKTDSPVRLVEYGDFQCPACFRYYPVLKEIKEKYKDKIAFQFRNFPLITIHPNAMAAHRAAQAAANQGKFWEMHDLLYENQQSWSQSISPTTTLERYAEELGLDLVQYNADVVSTEVLDAINADTDEGQNLGVTGTPTFVLNGEKIETPDPTLEAFSNLIDQALEESVE